VIPRHERHESEFVSFHNLHNELGILLLCTFYCAPKQMLRVFATQKRYGLGTFCADRLSVPIRIIHTLA
jgi:hypothetical protein